LEAAKYLLDRTWGKPSTQVSVQQEDGQNSVKEIDLSKYTAQELQYLERLLGLAKQNANANEDDSQ